MQKNGNATGTKRSNLVSQIDFQIKQKIVFIILTFAYLVAIVVCLERGKMGEM